MTDIATLGIKIEAKDIKQAVRELDRLEKQSGQTERATDNLRTQFSSLKTAVLGVVGAVGGLAIFATYTKDAIEYADAIAKTADKLGIATDTLQEYRFAAERSGVAQTALDVGVQRFTRRLGEAAEGTGVLSGVLEQYNIQIRDSEGRMRRTEEVLKDYADAIKNAQSPQEQLLLAFKAFDTEGAAMVNMLREGSMGLESLQQEARNAGVVMDENLIRKAEQMNDKWDTLTETIGTRFKSALISVASVFVQFDALTELNDQLDIQIKMLEKVPPQAQGYKAIADNIAYLKKQISELNAEMSTGGGIVGVNQTDPEVQAQAAADAQAFIFETEQQAINYANAWKLSAEAQAADERIALAELEARAKLQISKDFFGNLSVLMTAESKRLFNIGKVAAIASAVINTSEAVTKTMTSVPYPWNIPLAVAQGLAGGVQIQNIRNQTHGGGSGSVPSPGGGAGASVPTLPDYASPQVSEQGGGSFQVIIQGDFVGTDENIDRLVEGIQDRIDNRDLLLISSDSRQAAELA